MKNRTSKNAVRFSKLFGTVIILLLLVIVFLVSLVLKDFRNKMDLFLINDAESNLEQISAQNISKIKTQLNDSIHVLDGIAAWFSKTEDRESPYFQDLLVQMGDSSGYSEISYANIDGMIRTPGKEVRDISGCDPFIQALKGKSIISNLETCSDFEKDVIGVIVPVLAQTGLAEGALIGKITITQFSELLGFNSTDYERYTNIINKSGEYLTKIGSNEGNLIYGNFWLNMLMADFDNGFNNQKLRNAISNNQSGFASYVLNDRPMYFYYEPLGIDDYYAISAIPQESIETGTDYINQLANLHITRTIVLISIAIALILIWSSYIRIRLTKMNQELEFSEQRFQIAASQTVSTIFDFSILLKIISVTDASGSDRIINLEDPDFPCRLLSINEIKDDEGRKVRQLFKNIENGSESDSCVVYSKTEEGKSRWQRIRLTGSYDKKGIPVHAVGTIEDITSQKRMEHDLIAEAEHDALTGLLNRKAATSRIEKVLLNSDDLVLSGTEVHALMIIDIDDFKHVNDTLGHVTGDQLISDVALALGKTFRKTDTISRIGGDEFLVFLPVMTSTEAVEKKAEEFLNAIYGNIEKEGKSVQISCSIGISFFPGDGKDFFNLYQKADNALYYAKGKGKNRYVIYKYNYES
ncbi:MAG: diguanylate cyclase [Flexilinea sp.]